MITGLESDIAIRPIYGLETVQKLVRSKVEKRKVKFQLVTFIATEVPYDGTQYETKTFSSFIQLCIV